LCNCAIIWSGVRRDLALEVSPNPRILTLIFLIVFQEAERRVLGGFGNLLEFQQDLLWYFAVNGFELVMHSRF
jgi:hypothetical protein